MPLCARSGGRLRKGHAGDEGTWRHGHKNQGGCTSGVPCQGWYRRQAVGCGCDRGPASTVHSRSAPSMASVHAMRATSLITRTSAAAAAAAVSGSGRRGASARSIATSIVARGGRKESAKQKVAVGTGAVKGGGNERVDRLLSRLGQGLTLVHFSAQLEPCLTQENTLHSLDTP